MAPDNKHSTTGDENSAARRRDSKHHLRMDGSWLCAALGSNKETSCTWCRVSGCKNTTTYRQEQKQAGPTILHNVRCHAQSHLPRACLPIFACRVMCFSLSVNSVCSWWMSLTKLFCTKQSRDTCPSAVCSWEMLRAVSTASYASFASYKNAHPDQLALVYIATTSSMNIEGL